MHKVKEGVMPLKASELKKMLRENDCELYREGRSHEMWISHRTGKKFPVSRHGSQDVPKGTVNSIKRSAGIE